MLFTSQLIQVCTWHAAGVKRAHLVDARLDGGMLLELYSRDGVGTMISTDFYEGIRRAASRDLEAIAVSALGQVLQGLFARVAVLNSLTAYSVHWAVQHSALLLLHAASAGSVCFFLRLAQALLEPLQRTGVLVRRTPAELRAQLQHFTVIERETKVCSMQGLASVRACPFGQQFARAACVKAATPGVAAPLPEFRLHARLAVL